MLLHCNHPDAIFAELKLSVLCTCCLKLGSQKRPQSVALLEHVMRSCRVHSLCVLVIEVVTLDDYFDIFVGIDKDM